MPLGSVGHWLNTIISGPRKLEATEKLRGCSELMSPGPRRQRHLLRTLLAGMVTGLVARCWILFLLFLLGSR